jgi:excisionase family DNA binding protein
MKTQTFLTLDIDDLKSLLEQSIQSALKNYYENSLHEPNKKESGSPLYLTMKEVSGKFPISISTIKRYQKNGTLKFKRIGGKVLFLEADVHEAIQGIKINKYKN